MPMTSSEEAAAMLRSELETKPDAEDVLRRSNDTITWTAELAQAKAGKAQTSAINAATPQSTARKEARDARRKGEIEDMERRWWSYPPIMAAADDVIEVTFVDATGGDEIWDPERVPCCPTELFAHAAQRFRVSANKKYRHPFLPSYHFDLLHDGVRDAFDSFGSRTVGDVIDNRRDVRYVRNEKGRAHNQEKEKTPAKRVWPWDRASLLPSWCTTPDSWFEPTPPPGFAVPKVEGEQYYIKVPTLHIPCAGIRSPTIQPQIITRSLYLPVKECAGKVAVYPLQRDYVPLANRLVPSSLTVETARSLLGRPVQSYSGDGVARRVAIAWGLTLDDDGKLDWMHCVVVERKRQEDVVLDLKGQNRQFREGIIRENCAWVGAAMLEADMRASGNFKIEMGNNEQEEDQASLRQWTEKARRWIKNLNSEGVDKLVEVGQDGTLLAGDVELAKNNDEEFELCISSAKPGIWRVSSTVSTPIRFTWVREGTVDYDALPPSSGDPVSFADDDDSVKWEELGTFSVDSGAAGIFSQSVFSSFTLEGDRPYTVDTLVTAPMEGLGDPYVPGGIIVRGNDGGYVVEGTRDEDGRIVLIRMHETRED
ncbi:hypothetical protein PENSPDRAFT_607234 [Peniophora sp. CONT]|nr:hypothetical protein PENSPDRAFT_607234 [Peniophora sp. CONT]